MNGVARFLFVAVGMFWLVIGVLGAVLLDRGIGPPMVFVSERTDTVVFGGPPHEVLQANPQLRLLRMILIRTLSGTLVAAGLLTGVLAWFGLGRDVAWPLVSLTVVGLAVIPFWWAALAPYRQPGVSLGLGDVPPFMWLPAIVMPIASGLAWLDRIRG